MEKHQKYPLGAEHYNLFEEIGSGATATIYRAVCIPTQETVAIKVLDFEKENTELCKIAHEAQTMTLMDQPNLLKAHCSFVTDHYLWVVMPFMAASCQHIMNTAFPDGFEEAVIATILREVLKGLVNIHQHGDIHRDVKAGNILMDSRGAIKLCDFGASASLFDEGKRLHGRNTFTGTFCWMAPEVMEEEEYDFKADIWSFGITALELAHGHAPYSEFPSMKILMKIIRDAPPSLDHSEKDKKFSKSFRKMIEKCLVKDPRKRLSAQELLKHPFFKKARSSEYITRTLLKELPSLGHSTKESKIKQDMVIQKKLAEVERGDIGRYKKGFSGWNFDVEAIKTQASQLPDDGELTPLLEWLIEYRYSVF
ncbi:hypothetical protein C5167_004977 [Papaver somniferum]|uniref:Protein kinase domain-containing protein n=1 Tax=Papaver somniferum TaxID=3469 RepID=A0A4Y7JAX5_PAPSO|nr:serine/threonine-protein kinase fray2-like [Papaver somniferum]RZC57666.1 hypothetical protein C5167_004977 [Papaver somniferum]